MEHPLEFSLEDVSTRPLAFLPTGATGGLDIIEKFINAPIATETSYTKKIPGLVVSVLARDAAHSLGLIGEILQVQRTGLAEYTRTKALFYCDWVNAEMIVSRFNYNKVRRVYLPLTLIDPDWTGNLLSFEFLDCSVDTDAAHRGRKIPFILFHSICGAFCAIVLTLHDVAIARLHQTRTVYIT